MTTDDRETWSVTIDVPAAADVDGAGERHTFDVAADESILTVARREGLWLPADCQQGWCITCAAKLVEGEVDHGAAKRYYEEDVEGGFILPCVAKPRSDVTIRAAQYDAMLCQRAEFDQPPGRSKVSDDDC